MARTLAFGAALAQGNWACQEDGFLSDPSRRIFAVADGFGGRGAGDMAAKLALAALRVPPVVSAMEPGDSALTGAGRAALALANKQILERNRGRPPAGRGGCSLAVALLGAHGNLSLLQTGGCAALLWREGRLQALLSPQSAPRSGFGPAMPDHALGLGEAVRAEARELRLEAGDILLLVSSGLDWGGDALGALLAAYPAGGSSLEPLARQLVESAEASSAGLNRTVLALARP